MKYTHAQIGEAYDRYHERTDRVIEVLRMVPQLSKLRINTVANVSKDFMIINYIHQQLMGGMIIGTVEDGPKVCRELVLSCNPKMPKDKNLLDPFARIPLEVESNHFFFVAYDNETLDYVLKEAELKIELPRARVLLTKRGVPFYLVKEDDINGIFPARVRLSKDISVIFAGSR